jgi:hypothetical protein
MGLYSAAFNAIAVTAAQDVFEIVAPVNSQIVIHEIRLGQYSDFGDAQAEILSVSLLRGHTVSGSGGGTITPANLINPKSGALASTTTVERNNTTQASGGSPVTLIADTFNVAAGWWYYPPAEERIVIDNSQRFVVAITAPADSLTMNGTIIFEEIGQIPATT